MKYFRSPLTLEVFAFADDGSEDSFIDQSLVLMTSDEVNLFLNPPPTAPTVEDIRQLREMAYADVSSGSDRFFSESARHMAAEDHLKASKARELGLSRAREIQKQYPWPK